MSEPELYDVEQEQREQRTVASVWDVSCWLSRVCDDMGLERLSVKRLDAHRMHGEFMKRGIVTEAALRDALLQYLKHGAPQAKTGDLFTDGGAW